jgi:hypothetical protein
MATATTARPGGIARRTVKYCCICSITYLYNSFIPSKYSFITYHRACVEQRLIGCGLGAIVIVQGSNCVGTKLPSLPASAPSHSTTSFHSHHPPHSEPVLLSSSTVCDIVELQQYCSHDVDQASRPPGFALRKCTFVPCHVSEARSRSFTCYLHLQRTLRYMTMESFS